MKNVFLLPTDKPSRLIFDKEENRLLPLQKESFWMEHQDLMENRNLYITNDEEIRERDWFYDLDTKYVKIKQSWENSHLEFNGKKIILTTDQDLIKDGVQSIDDEFLEWLVNNPSCEAVKTLKFADSVMTFVYKIIIPKEEPKQLFTDYPITELGDEEFKEAPIRECKLLSYDKETMKSWSWYFRPYVHIKGFNMRILGVHFNIRENNATQKLINKSKAKLL